MGLLADEGVGTNSSRLLGEQLGLSNVRIAAIWRRWGLQPWRRESFKFSTDPQLEAKVRDVVGSTRQDGPTHRTRTTRRKFGARRPASGSNFRCGQPRWPISQTVNLLPSSPMVAPKGRFPALSGQPYCGMH
jgi:hypothetical protein